MRSCWLDVYLSLSLLPFLGHRPPTICLHTTRSCAVFSSSFQFFPVLLTSASKSLLQLLHGLLFFLFLGGFQVRACRVMLLGGFVKVCPNHLQRLCSISLSTGIWFVLSNNSELLKVSGQKISRMCLKQLFMKVYAFLIIQLCFAMSLSHITKLPFFCY